MTAFDRLKELCDAQGISVNKLEEKIGLSKNTLYSWKKNTPKGSNLIKVADYFNVSTDYLLGRADEPEPVPSNIPEWATARDKRDFKKMLEEDEELMFDGVPVSNEDKEKIKRIIEALFWDAKEKNKKTYGRKKTTDE